MRMEQPKEAKNNRFANILPVMRYFYAVAWRTSKPYFLTVLADMLMKGVSPFINIILPKFLIDELIGLRRVDVLVWLVAAIVLANAAVYVLNNFLSYFQNRFRTPIDNQITAMLAEKAMNLDFACTENAAVLTQLEKAKTGISWYSGGVGGLSGALTSVVSGTITMLGTVFILGMLSPLLIALLFVIIAGSVWITYLSEKQQAKFMKELVGVNRKFGYYFGLVKGFQYGKDIRLYGADALVLDRTDRYIREDWTQEQGLIRLRQKYTLIRTGINAVQQVLLYGYLGLRVLSGAIGIGDFQMLISSAVSFTGSLSGLLGQVVSLARICDFMNDYRLFMQYPSEQREGTRSIDMTAPHTFSFRDVSFSYPQSEALSLKHVTLDIPAGQKLSIVGLNGAGKTTFIKLLMRLYDPTGGRSSWTGWTSGSTIWSSTANCSPSYSRTTACSPSPLRRTSR